MGSTLDPFEIGGAGLLSRLEAALRDGAVPARFAKSIRINARSDWAGTLDHYEALAVGLAPGLSAAAPMLAGWWEQWAGQVADEIGRPGVPVAVEPGTDLDWFAWRLSWREVMETARATHSVPGLLATIDPGWVLFSPPSSSDLFLYPEVSASG